MSRFIKVASIDPQTGFAEEHSPTARTRVIRNLRESLDSLQNDNFDLILTSEATSWVAQGEPESLDAPGELLSTYSSFAKQAQCCIAGAVKLDVNGRIYNALAMFDNNGEVTGYYAKSCILLRELDSGINSGDGAKCFDLACGRCGAAICFDLNITQILDDYRPLNPEIMLFSTMFDGGILQSNWAFQLESFFISCIHTNESRIIDPLGQIIRTASYFTPCATATINLDYCVLHLDYHKVKFEAIRKHYGDEVIIDIPPAIGRAILYSQSSERSAKDIVKEYELTPARDYFQRTFERNLQDRIN